ncbi:hypothetical protein [Leadbetterella sp. DM7]|uniref:CHASE2 domain-containing protein n=1 Tax=Leadbetterella sp. DM7 TaxID=3235085 RepID=UPI00349E4F14
MLAKYPFILVDVTNQQQLIGSGVEGDTITSRSVTDRLRLTQFLNILLENEQYVGQIVCDVVFKQKSSADEGLLTVINSLNAVDKLLIAGTNSLPNYSISIDSMFNTEQLPVYSVDVVNYDGMYFSQSLVDGSGQACLPYELYLRMKNRQIAKINNGLGMQFVWEQERDSDASKVKYIGTSFIPHLSLSDEDIIAQPFIEGQTWLEQAFEFLFPTESGSIFTVSEMNIFNLADILHPEGIAMFEDELYKYSEIKPIILIGTFGDRQLDVHQTAFGRLHGSVILINIFYNLLAGHHIISADYVIYLFLSFTIIIALLFFLKIGPTEDNKLYRTMKARAKSKDEDIPMYTSSRIMKIVGLIQKYLYKVFVEHLHYWLLLLVVVGAIHFFGHLINIAVIIIFLTACSSSLILLKNLMK